MGDRQGRGGWVLAAVALGAVVCGVRAMSALVGVPFDPTVAGVTALAFGGVLLALSAVRGT